MAGGDIYTHEELCLIAEMALEGHTNGQIWEAFEGRWPGRRSRASIHSARAKDPRVREMITQGRASMPTPVPETPPDPFDPRETTITRLKDELAELRAQVRSRQGESVVVQVLEEAIRSHAQALPVTTKRPPPSSDADVEEDILALFSDQHADQIVKAERVLGFEEYGWPQFCRRFERWVDTLISWSQNHLAGHSFPRLWIAALGDAVEGDQHGASKHTTWGNTMKAALSVGDVLAQGIADLSEYFPEIIVVGVPGNHPRWSKKIDWRGAHESFDYLTLVQAATRLQGYIDEGRVTIHAPDAYQAVVNIRGYNFLLSHGHEVKSWNGIPFYGLERKNRRIQTLFSQKDVQLHYHCIGHFHQAASMATPAGELFINGAWPRTSEFAFDALAAANNPMQMLFGVHEERGVTWRLPVYVAEGADDITVPCRYDQRILYELAGVDRKARSGGVPVIRAA